MVYEDFGLHFGPDATTALGAVANKGDEDVLNILMSNLEDATGWDQGVPIVRALASIANPGDERVVKALTRALDHRDRVVRLNTTDALCVVASKGNQTVVDALRLALPDDPYGAAQALGDLANERDPDVLEALKRTWQSICEGDSHA